MLNTKGQKLPAKEKNKAKNQWLPPDPLFPSQDTKIHTARDLKRSNKGEDRGNLKRNVFEEAPTFSDQQPNWRYISFCSANATTKFHRK